MTVVIAAYLVDERYARIYKSSCTTVKKFENFNCSDQTPSAQVTILLKAIPSESDKLILSTTKKGRAKKISKNERGTPITKNLPEWTKYFSRHGNVAGLLVGAVSEVMATTIALALPNLHPTTKCVQHRQP